MIKIKKTVIFIVALSLTITLLIATPARAYWGFFRPGFPAGIGTASILDSFNYSPRYYYSAPVPGYYPPGAHFPESYYPGPSRCSSSYPDRWIPCYWENRSDPYYVRMRRL